MLCAADAIGGPFAVVNADDFYGRHAFEALHGYLRTASDGLPLDLCMVAYVLRNTLSDYGHVARGVGAEGQGARRVVYVLRVRRRVNSAAILASLDHLGERQPEVFHHKAAGRPVPEIFLDELGPEKQ